MTLEEYLAELCEDAETLCEAANTLLGINSEMNTKTTGVTTLISAANLPADFLANVELLPDGRPTVNKTLFFQQWAEVAQKQVAKGTIKLEEVKEYDPETGQVPNTFIYDFYLKQRKPN